jgi:limonene-1,2-epoxide hydrolase
MNKNAYAGNRRGFLAAVLGAGGVLAANAGSADAAVVVSPADEANVKVVRDFCAAWATHDLGRVMGFFAENPSYRMTETQEPTKGREPVEARIKSFINNVQQFEVLDTYARGPMVITERIDHFTNFQLKNWHGVGVFWVREGKIVEWSDYTMSTTRA